MKLQDHLPQGVFVDNKFYRLDFDFRNVLRMMEVLDRDDLMPEAKEFLALKCLTRHPRNVQKVLVAVRELLFQQKPKKDAKKVTDFEQDAGLIRAAFRQEFGVDLYRDKLHWIEFSEMLNAIPEGNRYAEVVGIRARPIPAPTKWNQHEREWLLKAKADVALHLSDAEQAKKYQEDVGKVFASLFGMIQKGSEIQNGE
jgi:hypothetical protein